MDILEAVRAMQRKLDALRRENQKVDGYVIVRAPEGERASVSILFFPDGMTGAAAIGIALEPGADIEERAAAAHRAANDLLNKAAA